MCKECGKPVLSNSFTGQKVKLYLLRDSKILQEMEGEYNSYGSVFVDGTQRGDIQHELRESLYWNDPDPDTPLDDYDQKSLDKGDKDVYWHRVCNMHFTNNKSEGFAAIHSKCFKGNIPVYQSEDDPNQGWGDDGELMGDVDPNSEIT